MRLTRTAQGALIRATLVLTITETCLVLMAVTTVADRERRPEIEALSTTAEVVDQSLRTPSVPLASDRQLVVDVLTEDSVKTDGARIFPAPF